MYSSIDIIKQRGNMSKKLIALLVACGALLVACIVAFTLMLVLETTVQESGLGAIRVPRNNLWGWIAPPLILVLFLAFMSCSLSAFTIWLSDKKREKEIKQGENLI